MNTSDFIHIPKLKIIPIFKFKLFIKNHQYAIKLKRPRCPHPPKAHRIPYTLRPSPLSQNNEIQARSKSQPRKVPPSNQITWGLPANRQGIFRMWVLFEGRWPRAVWKRIDVEGVRGCCVRFGGWGNEQHRWYRFGTPSDFKNWVILCLRLFNLEFDLILAIIIRL